MNSQPDFWELPNRPGAIFLFLSSGLLMLVGLHYWMERFIEGTFWPELLINRNGQFYPFTIHAVLHLSFFIGLAELFVRWRVAERETAFLREDFLPEDEEMRVAGVPLGDVETVDLFPLPRVRAAEHDNRSAGVDHVPVGAAAKREPELASPVDQVGERIVFPVVKHAADVGHLDLRQVRRIDCRGEDGEAPGQRQECCLDRIPSFHDIFVSTTDHYFQVFAFCGLPLVVRIWK